MTTVVARPAPRLPSVGGASRDPFVAPGGGKDVKVGRLAAKELSLSAAGRALSDALDKNKESGDGAGAFAYQFDPAALQAAVKTPADRDRLVFNLIVGKNGGRYDEYRTPLSRDVSRAGAFGALAATLQADDGDASRVGSPERKALQKSIAEFLKQFIGQPTTHILRMPVRDAGYGGFAGVVAINTATGRVNTLVNTWAP